MLDQAFFINQIPATLYGAPAEQCVLFVHGKHGSKAEAAPFAALVCPLGWQVLSADLPDHGDRTGTGGFDPWHAVPELETLMTFARRRWDRIALRADSIGAWFSLLAFAQQPPERALFVSPVLDMPRLIQTMLGWAGVTETELQQRDSIETHFGETLSWPYYQYALAHPVEQWACPTAILYAGRDTLTERQTVENFTRRFACDLTVAEDGEHWFHTPPQLEILRRWTVNQFT